MGSDDSDGPEYAADYTPAPEDASDASHLTPEEKRGPRTIHVALGLLAALLILAVATDPTSVLPRDSTLHGAHYTDETSGLKIAVPVGWRALGEPELGSVRLVPVGTGHALDTRILAGTLDPGIAASAISDDEGAAIALAETVQQYVLGISGTRDEKQVTEIENDAGDGAAVSYVLVPDDAATTDAGGLVYAAVFGSQGSRWWVAYVTTEQQSTPGTRWMDRIVNDIRLAE